MSRMPARWPSSIPRSNDRSSERCAMKSFVFVATTGVVARSPDRATFSDRRSPVVSGGLRSVGVARSGDRATTAMKSFLFVAVALFVLRPGVARSQDLGGDVLRVFAAKCAGCHGPNLPKPKGRFGYVLDLRRV